VSSNVYNYLNRESYGGLVMGRTSRYAVWSLAPKGMVWNVGYSKAS
jgi:hypothetical protein